MTLPLKLVIYVILLLIIRVLIDPGLTWMQNWVSFPKRVIEPQRIVEGSPNHSTSGTFIIFCSDGSSHVEEGPPRS